MKKVIRSVFTTGSLFCLFNISATAQTTPHRITIDSVAAQEARYVTAHLKLSDQQRELFQQETKRHQQSVDSLNKMDLSPEQRTLALKELLARYNAALKSGLTAGQYSAYTILMEKRKTAFKKELEKKGKVGTEIN